MPYAFGQGFWLDEMMIVGLGFYSGVVDDMILNCLAS